MHVGCPLPERINLSGNYFVSWRHSEMHPIYRIKSYKDEVLNFVSPPVFFTISEADNRELDIQNWILYCEVRHIFSTMDNAIIQLPMNKPHSIK